jgi:hypothetical protein
MPTMSLLQNAEQADRRSEPRLRFSWQMYFQQNWGGRVEQGRMLDLSSKGAAFLAPADTDLWPGKRLSLRITHPMVSNGLFTVLDVRREGEVIRVEPQPNGRKRVAVRLTVPLDYCPAGEGIDRFAAGVTM